MSKLLVDEIGGNAAADTTIASGKKIAGTASQFKMTDVVQGDVLYGSAADTLSRLAPGTSGQVLQTQGAGANPVWAADAEGKVLQVLHFQDNGAGTATSVTASWTDTATTLGITCSATTSKVLIMFAGTGYGYRNGDANQYFPLYQLYETATTTAFPGGTPTRFIRGTTFQAAGGASNRIAGACVGTALHSPNSTSALTYTVQIKNSYTSVAWNETTSEAATITLMEIGA